MKTPFSSKIKFDYSGRLKNNLIDRNQLTINLCPEKFNRTFWMKWELILFCKKNNIKQSGSKKVLNQRIYTFLTKKEDK